VAAAVAIAVKLFAILARATSLSLHIFSAQQLHEIDASLC